MNNVEITIIDRTTSRFSDIPLGEICVLNNGVLLTKLRESYPDCNAVRFLFGEKHNLPPDTIVENCKVQVKIVKE